MLPLPDGIDDYLRVHSSAEDPLLAELAQETYANAEYPQMQTGHVEGLLLRLLVQLSGARRVLEIGTYTGYSGLSMAMGLPDDGELVTCDIDEEATAMARRYWQRSPHGSKITLKLAPALDTIATLQGPFDLVFMAGQRASPNQPPTLRLQFGVGADDLAEGIAFADLFDVSHRPTADLMRAHL